MSDDQCDDPYGDADVTSKRRKQPESTDNYSNAFRKRLIECEGLNSTSNDDSACDLDSSSIAPKCSDDAADQRPTITTITLAADEPDDDWQTHQLLSKRPSGSSFGFENTFRVLEQQMRGSNDVPSSQYRLQRGELQRHPIFLDVPHGRRERFLRAISEERSSCTAGDSDIADLAELDDEPPSFLELELDARQRIRELSAEAQQNEQSPPALDADFFADEPDGGCRSISELLYGVPVNGDASDEAAVQPFASLVQEDIQQQTGEYPEYVYHMARGKDGRKYLRVVRSLLVDKVLCGNRVSQMTRAYDDIEAVTRLLEEKSKDLELTVQIGKELLTQNTRLENRVAELESDVKAANENLAQLSYDLHTKSSLLAALTNDEDVSSEASTPNFSKSFNLDLLQKKIGHLEDENKSLRAEAMQIVHDTDAVEEQERKLMADITAQLNNAHYQYDGVNLELERYREENKFQHEQIVHLTAKLAEAEIRLHQLTSENEEQTSRLSITEENQNQLASELNEFKARYHEVLALLQETQEQLRQQRRRAQPMVRGNALGGMGASASFGGGLMGPCGPIDSLQSELMESSLFSDNSLDSGIASERGGGGLLGMGSSVGGLNGSGAGKPAHAFSKVFETVRCASKAGQFADNSSTSAMSQLGAMSMSSSSGVRMSSYPYAGSSASSNRYASSVYSGSLGAKSYSRESLLSESDGGGDPDSSYPGKAPTGVPGAPGAKDLEAALRRLTPAQVLARRSMLSNAPPGTYQYDEPSTGTNAAGHGPMGIRTPDSIMSTGSFGGAAAPDSAGGSVYGRSSLGSTKSSASGSSWRLPDKLLIVKPMEGSQTLHHWNRLATPSLGGLLEERPGVVIRGGRGLDELGMHVYSLSDVEEDECDEPAPAKQFGGTYSSVYTYTNSTVMHPDDGTSSVSSSVPASQMSSRVESASSSRQPSAPATPRHGMSRRNSCSTFSVNMGLASMLNERGIKGVTPSAINTPAGPNFSPTVTPCNSPDGSPTRDRSPEPALFAGLFSSGADMLRRKLAGSGSEPPMSAAERQSRMTARNQVLLSRQEKRALRSLRLLEKVESLGLDSIASAQRGLSPLAMQANAAAAAASPAFGGAGRRTARNTSPMAQLTSLKSLAATSGGSSDSECSTTSSARSPVAATSQPSQSQRPAAAIAAAATAAAMRSAGGRPARPNSVSIGAERKADGASGGAAAATSPTDNARLKQMQRQKSRRALLLQNGQRSDLGTVAGGAPKVRPDLGRVVAPARKTPALDASLYDGDDTDEPMTLQMPPATSATQSIAQSFVGTISSLFFGRKGGLL